MSLLLGGSGKAVTLAIVEEVWRKKQRFARRFISVYKKPGKKCYNPRSRTGKNKPRPETKITYRKRCLPASNRMPQWASSPTLLWGWAFLHRGSQAKSGKVALLNNAVIGQAQSPAEHPLPSLPEFGSSGSSRYQNIFQFLTRSFSDFQAVRFATCFIPNVKGWVYAQFPLNGFPPLCSAFLGSSWGWFL